MGRNAGDQTARYVDGGTAMMVDVLRIAGWAAGFIGVVGLS